MTSTRCPGCGETISGDLTTIKAHVKSCSRKKSAVAPTPSRDRIPQQIVEPVLPFVIRVPIRVESQNKSQYAHWRVYSTYRNKWYSGIVPFIAPLRGLRLPWSHWSIERVYTGRSREMDYGNLVGGTKPIFDSLTRNAVILDDKPSCFKCDYSQRRGDEEIVILTLLEARYAPSEQFPSVPRSN